MHSPLTSLDSFITDRSLLTHFFYKQKWNKGELTLPQLRIYAQEYFHLVRRVPGIVARVRDRALERGDTVLAEKVDKNIAEETEHIELWKRFARSLGMQDSNLTDYDPSQQTKEAVEELEALAEASLEDGVTAMYAMELALPEIAQSKKDGLCEHYGLTSEDAHCYFDEHLNEEEHFGVWREVPVDAERAEATAQKSLAAQHKLLDGVCERCDITCPCEA